jgi:hypothetical protein
VKKKEGRTQKGEERIRRRRRRRRRQRRRKMAEEADRKHLELEEEAT